MPLHIEPDSHPLRFQEGSSKTMAIGRGPLFHSDSLFPPECMDEDINFESLNLPGIH